MLSTQDTQDTLNQVWDQGAQSLPDSPLLKVDTIIPKVLVANASSLEINSNQHRVAFETWRNMVYVSIDKLEDGSYLVYLQSKFSKRRELPKRVETLDEAQYYASTSMREYLFLTELAPSAWEACAPDFDQVFAFDYVDKENMILEFPVLDGTVTYQVMITDGGVSHVMFHKGDFTTYKWNDCVRPDIHMILSSYMFGLKQRAPPEWEFKMDEKKAQGSISHDGFTLHTHMGYNGKTWPFNHLVLMNGEKVVADMKMDKQCKADSTFDVKAFIQLIQQAFDAERQAIFEDLYSEPSETQPELQQVLDQVWDAAANASDIESSEPVESLSVPTPLPRVDALDTITTMNQMAVRVSKL